MSHDDGTSELGRRMTPEIWMSILALVSAAALMVWLVWGL